MLPPLEPLGNHEILGRAAVGLGDEFERLDERDLDVFLLEQGGERLGGDFLEVRERKRALARGEDFWRWQRSRASRSR